MLDDETSRFEPVQGLGAGNRQTWQFVSVEGDLLIAISTSGTSPNIIAAVMEARRRGCKIIGMTGASGKKLAALSDLCIMVPSERTARIQELHITIAHIWCEMIDDSISGTGK